MNDAAYEQFEEAIRYASNSVRSPRPVGPRPSGEGPAGYRTRPSYGTRGPMYPTTLNSPTDTAKYPRPHVITTSFNNKTATPPSVSNEQAYKPNKTGPRTTVQEYVPGESKPAVQVAGANPNKLVDDGVPLHLDPKLKADADYRLPELSPEDHAYLDRLRHEHGLSEDEIDTIRRGMEYTAGVQHYIDNSGWIGRQLGRLGMLASGFNSGRPNSQTRRPPPPPTPPLTGADKI